MELSEKLWVTGHSGKLQAVRRYFSEPRLKDPLQQNVLITIIS